MKAFPLMDMDAPCGTRWMLGSSDETPAPEARDALFE
jgi:hypothetical protein